MRPPRFTPESLEPGYVERQAAKEREAQLEIAAAAKRRQFFGAGAARSIRVQVAHRIS